MFAVILGKDINIGTSGILNVETESGSAEFFRIREIHRVRSGGSYPVVDCDIRDSSGTREVKLAKSRPVAASADIDVTIDKGLTVVLRRDNAVVIKVEVLSQEQLLQIIASRQSAPLPPAVRAHFADLPEDILQDISDNSPPPLPLAVPQAIQSCQGAIRITGDFRAGPYRIVADQDGFTIEGRLSASGNIRVGTGPMRLTKTTFSM